MKPHTSRLVFIRGRCTIGLYTLIHTLVATNITNTLLIGYGIKITYVECFFLDHFDGPNQTRRFDIGRNVDTGSIPVFGITDQHCGDSMFGDMGAGYGSTLLNIPSSNSEVQSLTLKCYPRILHHFKATGITMDLPNTNRGMQTKLTRIMDFIANIGNNIGGFRYKFVFYTIQSHYHCHQMIADYPTIAEVPSELEIAQSFTSEMYRTNVLDAIKKAKSYISRGATNATPTLLQKTVMVELLNALGFFQKNGVIYLEYRRR